MRDDAAVYTAYEDYLAFDVSEPEKNLMRSILRTAMDDMKRSGEPYRDARRYFLENDSSHLFSFVNICMHLNLSARSLRAKVGLAPEDELLAA